jgi:hypothetical protein
MQLCTITILIRNQFYEKILFNFHAFIGLFEINLITYVYYVQPTFITFNRYLYQI